MTQLVDIARKHIASLLEDVEGEDDFMPFMTIRGRGDDDGVIYVGLMMPDPGEPRDYIADVMLALCAIHRAVEVVFVSTVWMVTKTPDNDVDTTIAPSQNPARVEVVFMHHATTDGDASYSAPVIRENNTVTTGEWVQQPPATQIGGRFGDAIHTGMQMGSEFDPGWCEYIDDQLAKDKGDELVASVIKALTTARTLAEKAREN